MQFLRASESQIGVLSHPRMKGLRPASQELTYDWRHADGAPENTGCVQPVCSAHAIDAALTMACPGGEECFVPYVMANDDGIALRFPRVSGVMALPWLRRRGWRVWCTAVVVSYNEHLVTPAALALPARYLRGTDRDRFVVIPIDACDPAEYVARSVEAQHTIGMGSTRATEWWRTWPLRSGR